jgi:hypothetical protein
LVELSALANDIEGELNCKRDASALLERYERLCGRRVPPDEFVGYYGSMSTEHFARGTLVPDPVSDATLTDGDLQELIRRIVCTDYPDDNHYGYWLRILEVNIPHPDMTGVLAEHPDASPSELLLKAREYQAICL